MKKLIVLIFILGIIGLVVQHFTNPEKTDSTRNNVSSLESSYNSNPNDTSIDGNSTSNTHADGYNNNYQSINYGNRVSLDTTGDYTGLRLKRYSTKNDFIRYNIEKNDNNAVFTLTGDEPQVKLAVMAFNAANNANGEAYKKLLHPKNQAGNYATKPLNCVAYKIIEYSEYSADELKAENDRLNRGVGLTATEQCRITLEIYKYEEKSYGPYTDTTLDPNYFIVTVYKIDGQYYVRGASMVD